ncbi:hypothetical protein [Nonomuraea soli]|uniref:Uncharacterized protein n=1 Tax=Nonomuraea soli TaxID=1032476 RepID=A0A7W0CUC4_9ACTN|nr:hypothetical protein [Nonomuraea soli]MBA2897402.1 hypothetical protein [Nonomuraea soli]
MIIRRLVARLPDWVQRQPISVMCALLGFPSGLAALIGPVSSRALDTVLPSWARLLWAGCLIVGCLAWSVGLTSMKRIADRLVITREASMIFGLQLISMAAIVYATTIIITAGWAGVLAAWPLTVVAGGTAVQQAVLANDRDASRGR